MALMTTSSAPTVFDPAMSEVFLDGAIRLAEVDYFRWMRTLPSTSKTIEKTAINPPGAYSAHVEGNDYSYAAVVEGNKKTYTLARVALAAQMSADAALFVDRVAQLEFVRQIGASAFRKLNLDGYGVLSGGFTDTGPDGQALFAAAHGAVVGGTQSNKGSGALNEANLQAALTVMRRTKTPDNILAGVVPRFLIVPPDLEYTAGELVRSALSGADMQLNLLSTKGLEVLVSPELTDTTDWFLLDPDGFRARMYVALGSSPKQWIDTDSDNWRVKDAMVYAVGYDAWRGSFGASVA